MGMFLPALITGVSALAGGLLNRPKTTQQSGSQSTNSSQDTNSLQTMSSMPTYDPLQLQMRNYLLGQFANRLDPAQISGVVKGTINQGVQNINDSSNTSEQMIKNMLASRGLSYSGASSTPLVSADLSRLGQITQLRNSEPLLADQLQQSRLSSFADFLGRLPTGTTGTVSQTGHTEGAQHTDQSGSVTDPGNILGGAVSGAGSSLALMYGLGAFSKNKSTGGGRA